MLSLHIVNMYERVGILRLVPALSLFTGMSKIALLIGESDAEICKLQVKTLLTVLVLSAI